AVLNRLVRDRVYEITQGNTWLHFASEAHQYRFRHIQRHYTCGCGERHKARTRWERNTHGETRMGDTTGTNGIWEQHAVQPAVDNTVTRAQDHTTTVNDDLRREW